MMLKIATLVIIAQQVSSIGITDDPSSLRKRFGSVAHTLGNPKAGVQCNGLDWSSRGKVCMSSCEPTGFDGDFAVRGPGLSITQASDWCEQQGVGSCEFHVLELTTYTGEVAWKPDGCIEERPEYGMPDLNFHAAVMCSDPYATDPIDPPVDPAPAPVANISCGELEPLMVCNGGMDAVCSNETLTLDQCQDWCATQGVGCCGMVKDYVEGVIEDCGVCKFWEGLSSCSETQGEGLAATMCASEMV